MRALSADRLKDALEAIDKIERHTAGLTLDEFEADDEGALPLTERWLLIVVETANHLKEPHLSAAYGSIPNLRHFRTYGNAIRHSYSNITAAETWKLVQESLPAIKRDITTTLERIERDPSWVEYEFQTKRESDKGVSR